MVRLAFWRRLVRFTKAVGSLVPIIASHSMACRGSLLTAYL